MTHSSIVLSLAAVLLFVSAAMLAVPYLTHRDILFGVPVPPGFRSTELGRKALNRFRLWIALATAAGLAWILFLPASDLIVAGFLLTPATGLTAFVALNRKLKRFAIQPPLARETTLEPDQPLPWFIWLGIVPLLFLAATAVYVHVHWDQIPERFPIHFDINGDPNGWAGRTVRGVYGPLIFGSEFVIFLFVMMLAGWFGSRKSDSMRRPVLAVLLAAESIVAIIFALIPLQAAGNFRVPLPVMVVGPLALLIPAIVYAVHESNKPRGPVDPTPNECWKAGIIYNNPNDAALFVQRRDGMGFTINFGNRWSWVVFGALALMIGSGPLVLGILSK